jgi:hypothetical protein
MIDTLIVLNEEITKMESAKEEIESVVKQHNIIKIKINHKMVKYIDDILAIIGDKYADLIYSCNNVEDGKIEFWANERIPGPAKTVQYIGKVVNINLHDLDMLIRTSKANYLVMNRNTMNLLNKNDYLDEYPSTATAYYHSYRKIPIATCELLETGKIDFICTLRSSK